MKTGSDTFTDYKLNIIIFYFVSLSHKRSLICLKSHLVFCETLCLINIMLSITSIRPLKNGLEVSSWAARQYIQIYFLTEKSFMEELRYVGAWTPSRPEPGLLFNSQMINILKSLILCLERMDDNLYRNSQTKKELRKQTITSVHLLRIPLEQERTLIKGESSLFNFLEDMRLY